MRTIRYHLLLLFIAVVALGCYEKSGGSSQGSQKQLPKQPATTSAAEHIDRKLVKEANIRFRTDDMNATHTTIMKAVQDYKGYVSRDEASTYGGQRTNTLTIQVPAEDFDAFLSAATTGVDDFESRNINVKDVTDQHIDISARLKTKKELEARYRGLLDKAKTVQEMLEIERELTSLRGDIESIEGRLAHLESTITYSTIYLTYYRTISVSASIGMKFSEGFKDGWHNFIEFIIVLTKLWPFVLMAIGLTWFLRRRARKKKQQKSKQA